MNNQVAVLLQQIRLMQKAVSELPTEELLDGTKWPNALQQRSLLDRARESLAHAEWALEDYTKKDEHSRMTVKS